MRTKTIYILAIVISAFGFSCQSKPQKTTEKKEFQQFMEQFHEIRFPAVYDSVINYFDQTYLNTVGYKKKSPFKAVIYDSFLPQIDYDTLIYSLHQYAIHKHILQNDFNVIVFSRYLAPKYNQYIEGQGLWLVLATYSSGGDLIDTLFIAGSSHELFDQKAEITEDLKIRIQGYAYSPYNYEQQRPGPTDEYELEYKIDPKTGRIVCKTSQIRRVDMNATTYAFEPVEPFRPCPCPPKCRY
jgi:hypothetical protein